MAAGDKTPIYHQIEEYVLKCIEDGVYKEGESIPTEKEFCRMFNASRATVNKALNHLTNNGVIYRTPGRGSFVRMHSFERQIKKLMSFSEQMNSLNIPASSHIVGVSEVIAKRIPKIQETFGVSETEFIHKLERVRYVDGQVIAVECIYLNPKVIETINAKDIGDSLYRYIEETCKLRIGSSKFTITAIQVPEDIRPIFPCEVTVPILKHEQISFLMDGRVFEFNEIYYLGDRYEYRGSSYRE